MKIRSNKVIRASKKKPNRPNTDDPRQDLRSKAKHQMRHSRSGGAQPAGIHHNQLMVAATAVVVVFFPGASVSHGLFFSHVIFIHLSCDFAFKSG